MPQSFTIECPSCAIRLHCLPSASGKRLQCPQCQTWMMVPDAPATAYEVPVAEVEVAPPRRRPQPRDEFAEIADFGSYEMYLAPPRPRRRKPAKKKQAKWVLPVIIAGSCVLGLLFVGAFLFAMVRQFRVATLDVDEPMAYLAIDSEMILVVRFDELRRDPEVADALRQMRNPDDFERFLKIIGLQPDDFVMIAVGLTNAGDEDDPVAVLRNGGLILFESRKTISRFRFGLGMSRASHAGKEYLRDRRKTMGVTAAVFFPNEKSFIIAGEPTIKKLLEVERPTIARSRFAFTDFKSSMVVAYSSPRGQSVPRIAPRGIESIQHEVANAASILDADLRKLAVCYKFDASIDGTVHAVCGSPREAAALAAALEQSPQKRRALVDHLLPVRQHQMPGAPDDALRQLRIATDGSRVVVSTRFPKGR